MSSDPSEPRAADKLQFDEIESVQPRDLTCASCQNQIKDSYYEVNSYLLCSACRDAVEASLRSGSGVWRFLRASVYGVAAAAVGALLYFGVRAATGYEVGLISILVGIMVGRAVHKGSDGRGGWLYQGLAIYLTYASIVTTYVPLLIQAGRERQTQAGKADPGKDEQRDAFKAELENASKPELVLRLALLLFLLFLVAHAIPILMGPQNLIGWIIIGIGLYEAWKMNPRPAPITGPYQLTPGGTSPQVANPHDAPRLD